MLNIPHNALVFVGDGRKALFLRNDGDAKFPNLTRRCLRRKIRPRTSRAATGRDG